jgi:hypothetical protein
VPVVENGLATFRRKILFFRRWVNSAAQSKARRG